MDLIIDSGRQIQGVNIVRCSKCRAFLEFDRLALCGGCHNPICPKCGHCKCDLSVRREIETQLKKDVWEGEVTL